MRTVLKRLFRLLLRLVQLSERFVPQCAMLRRQLLLLRDRILAHRTQDARIDEIGALLTAGRFEEAARLINRAASVEWLFQAADAVAGQLESGPTPLSKVFEAIEDACPEPSVKVRVFYAGVLSALGRYLAAGDTLMAARTGASASLLKSLDLEARALRPMQINGRQPNLEGKRTIVILDLDADLRLVNEWLERYPDTQIVAENEDAFPYLGPSAARLTTFSSMMDSNSSVLSAVLKDVVDAFSEEFTSALARTFRDSPSARSFLAVQRSALKASMRKRLIKPVLRTLMIRTVLEQHTDEPIVVLVGSTSFLVHFETCLRRGSRSSPIAFMASTRDRRARTEIRMALDRIAAANLWPHTPPPSRELSAGESKAAADSLSETFAAVKPDNIEPAAGDRCIFLVRWASKTVAGTMRHLLMQSPSKVDTVLVSVDRNAARAKLSDDVNNIRAARPEAQIRIVPSSHRRPVQAQRGAARLTAAIWAHCGNSQSLTVHGPSMRSIVYDQVSRFASGRLWTLAHIHQLVGLLIDGAERSVVAVAPPGHAKALAAQDAARALGCRSIDIQHAYTSTDYHYSKPHGDIVTAIDQWSVDLFVQHFKVDPAAIRKVGTPRFDEIPRIIAETENAANPSDREFPLHRQNLPMVLFAAQPGHLDKNRRLLRLMAQIDVESGPINIVNKLHPSESDAVLSAYLEHAKEVSKNFVHVIRDFEIHQLIKQAEVVVTIFSNVGIEAAIWGKKLIIANLEREDLPLPLDKLNIGLNAYSEREFLDALRGLLSNGKTLETLNRRRRSFFRKNEHLRQGDSVAKIWALIEGNMMSPSAVDHAERVHRARVH